MNKWKNIFWHQGYKIYDSEEIPKKKRILNRVNQLENHITKSLLNILEHANNEVIHKFIKELCRINKVKINLSNNIKYEFQITDRNKFNKYKNQYLLKLISKLTEKIENDVSKDVSKGSIPDAAIYNNSTVILIEAKTQSPLYRNQLENHINNYIPNAVEIEITWEEIFDIFQKISPHLNKKDKFLLVHYCNYLDIIALSNFHRFDEGDFSSLTFLPDYDNEQRVQQLRKILTKIKKIHLELWEKWGKLNFKESKFGKITKKGENIWFAYYSHEDKASHANLNFVIYSDGFYIDVNAETSRSFRQFVDSIKKRNNQFNSLINNIRFDFKVVLWTKLPLAPERQNRFYWKEICEIAKKNINSKNILNKIDLIEQDFEQIVKKMISEVESSYKYSTDNTKYFKRTYISGRKTKKPLSSCVIRFRYLINKDRILGMERKNLIKEIIEVSKEFKKIIDFINR